MDIHCNINILTYGSAYNLQTAYILFYDIHAVQNLTHHHIHAVLPGLTNQEVVLPPE